MHGVAKKSLWFRSNRPSYKFSQNCEFRLFQRPDEAKHRGFDKICEMDMAKPGNFISNFQPLNICEMDMAKPGNLISIFQPLNREDVQKIVDETVGFEKFSEPMQ
ncbi:hypothetical protein T484DRAFT_1815896, partial [Baffinella frigidus]